MALIVDDLIENLPNINSGSDNHLRLAKIAQEVCAKHGIEGLDRKKTSVIIAARYEFFYRALAETTDTAYKICRIVGCDHTTVSYGASRYAMHNNLPMPRSIALNAKARSAEDRNYPKTVKQKSAATINRYLKSLPYEIEKEFETRRDKAKRGSAALLERLREVHGQP